MGNMHSKCLVQHYVKVGKINFKNYGCHLMNDSSGKFMEPESGIFALSICPA